MSRSPDLLRHTFAFKGVSDWVNTDMLKNPFKYSINASKVALKDPIRGGYMLTGAPQATAPNVLLGYTKATFNPEKQYSFSTDTKNNPNAKKATEAGAAQASAATAQADAAKAAKLTPAATASARDSLLKQQTILGQSTNLAGTSIYTV